MNDRAMMEEPKTGQVNWVQKGGIARVTLQNVAKFNAMSSAMWSQLKRAFEELNAAPDVRCVLLQGADGHFCAGGDISEYPSFRFNPKTLEYFHEVEVWGGLSAVLDCPVPVVALIEGNCMGAGVEIASACDIRLATVNARFGAPIAKLGFPMAPREAALVLDAVGPSTANAMLLAAEVFDAQHMHTQGFLTRVLPADQLAGAGEEIAQRIGQLAPHAARCNKQTLRGRAPQHPYAYAASDEHREGIEAFLAKRAPVF